jgi:hypothetical protein
MKNFEENYNSFIMKFNLKSTIILFSVLFVTVATFAQQTSKTVELKRIHDYLETNTNTELFPDTSRMYTFAFKVRVIKNKKGGYMVDSITVNDPIAYTLFPSFMQLKNIDYSVFLKNESEASLILPVVLDVWKDTWPKPAQEIDHRELLSKAFGFTNQEPITGNIVYLKPFMAWYKLTNYY